MRYTVDGLNPNSGFDFSGGPDPDLIAPFVIFDIESQENLPGFFGDFETAQKCADGLNRRDCA